MILNHDSLAKDLIMRMCSIDAHYRYSASLALKHPWITREFNAPIPLTIYEEDMMNKNTIEIVRVMKTMFFSAACGINVLC